MSYVGAPNVGIGGVKKLVIEERVDKVEQNFHHSALRTADSELSSIDVLSLVMPYIYISDWETAIDLDYLLHKNIHVVLNVCEMRKSAKTEAEMTRRKIQHFHVSVENLPDTNITSAFNTTFTIIKMCMDKKMNILVHCTQGISNSAAFVTYYALKNYYARCGGVAPPTNILSSIINKLKSQRPCIDINFGFLEQLEDVEEKLTGRALTASQSLSIRRNPSLKQQLNAALLQNVQHEKTQAAATWGSTVRTKRF
jgi:protein tyrosine phosphatase